MALANLKAVLVDETGGLHLTCGSGDMHVVACVRITNPDIQLLILESLQIMRAYRQ